MKDAVILDGESLTLEDLVAVARHGARVAVPEHVRERVQKSREVLEDIVRAGSRCYGVTTGFGPLGRVLIRPEEGRELQENLLRSHAVGVGPPLPTEVVRAAMLLRANTLAKGRSGVRPELLDRLVELLNARAHPVVPSLGSVGASGDLAPLAHMALALVGRPEGLLEMGGEVLRADEGLARLGLRPLELNLKEGLALVNGTSISTALTALAAHDALVLAKTADVALSMCLEAVGGYLAPFDEEYLALRPFAGQMACAKNVRELVRGSELVEHPGLRRAQDPYCIRCAPQVHGAAREAIAFARSLVQVELNSADDNPLIFEEEPRCRAGGNFHAQPIALAADVLATGLCTLGNISERRANYLLSGRCELLPEALVPPSVKAGLHSGLMIVQYTAAALVAELRQLASPASVQNVPTGADFEDVVSMSLAAALKARRCVELLARVLAAELVCAFQALSLREPERAGEGTRAAYEFLRAHGLRPVEADRPLGRDVERVAQLVLKAELLEAVEEAVGELA